MHSEIILDNIMINSVPHEQILIDTVKIVVEFNDVNTERWRITFNPYQAFRITTIDCIDTKLFMVSGKRPRHLIKIADSEWVIQLKNELKKKDHNATFMNEGHHYVFPFQDIIIELVAWADFSIEKI